MVEPLLRLYSYFEKLVVGTLLLIMMLVVLLATGEFVYLLIANIGDRLNEIDEVGSMQSQVHMALAGILVVLLCLELAETVKMYLKDHVIHLKLVFVVALIAVARHAIALDYHHADPMSLFGIAALVLALSVSYYLLRRMPDSEDGRMGSD